MSVFIIVTRTYIYIKFNTQFAYLKPTAPLYSSLIPNHRQHLWSRQLCWFCFILASPIHAVDRLLFFFPSLKPTSASDLLDRSLRDLAPALNDESEVISVSGADPCLRLPYEPPASRTALSWVSCYFFTIISDSLLTLSAHSTCDTCLFVTTILSFFWDKTCSIVPVAYLQTPIFVGVDWTAVKFNFENNVYLFLILIIIIIIFARHVCVQ